jgi:chromate transporter
MLQLWSIFRVFLRLGSSSFGGPVAHIARFREEFVQRRKWLSEDDYADTVSMCQFLPGPASSQVGMRLGMLQAGHAGAIAAWIGFTLPSAVLLYLFAVTLSHQRIPSDVLHSLHVVTVAVVAAAVWDMAKPLWSDRRRLVLMVGSACAIVLLPAAWGQIAVLVSAAFVGRWMFASPEPLERQHRRMQTRRRVGAVWLTAFFGLLLALSLVADASTNGSLRLFAAFYRTGSMVFGGGHVVLPVLQSEVVGQGLVGQETFLAGYSVAQAMPGPLFALSMFLGATAKIGPSGMKGAVLCLVAMFLPSFLLVAGVTPFWERFRDNAHARATLAGVNAAVVGLLLAALYRPVMTSALHAPWDVTIALVLLGLLKIAKLPPWLVVLGAAATSWIVHVA